MSIVNRIRAMITDYTAQEIATSLRMPLELVEGIINGTIDESALEDYDPASKVTVVDKHIITRGHILAVLENPKLAAEIALRLSNIQSTAVIDLEKYATLPIHLGLDIKSIPKTTNYLWDNNITPTAYKKNLYLYAMPQQTETGLNQLFRSHPCVVINCSVEQMANIYPVADIFYIPVKQDGAGIYFLYQILKQYKQYETYTHVVWLCKNNNEKYLSQLRCFTSAPVAGCLHNSNYGKQLEKILEPILPAKKKRGWF